MIKQSNNFVPDDNIDFGQQSFVRLGHDDWQSRPEDHEDEEGELPGPGRQEDSVFSTQNRVHRAQNVLVAGSLQTETHAGQHEETVSHDVDLKIFGSNPD